MVWTIMGIVFVCLFIRSENNNSITSSASQDIQAIFGIWKIWKYLRILLLFSIVFLLSIVIAHPYKLWSDIEIKKDGIDIVIVMDVSGSMDFTDFSPSRMEVAKLTLTDFISEISSDRVWLIVFSGKPISSQPLTFDYQIINETIVSLSTQIINQNIPGLSWTNIWDALLLSKWLFDTPERQKIVILITDWDANSWADPVLSAQVLADDGITIYPIWIGKDTASEVVVNNWFFDQRQTVPPLNTTRLEKIADVTQGVFFKAADKNTLTAIFQKLEELQTSEITTNVTQYKIDYYTPFMYMLMLLLSILSFSELIYPRCK